MNFQNLEYFKAVADEGNITKAAERLNVSQQALSNLIGRLEEELGCRLFERKQNLKLTYSGKQFLESTDKILDIQRQTASAIEDINDNKRGELRIGISHTRGQAILPLLLPAFSRRYPQVELHVMEGSTSLLEENLRKGVIDVLIGFAPFMLEGAEYSELMKEYLYLIIPDALLSEHFGSEKNKILQRYEQEADISIFKELPFVLLRQGDRIRTIVEREFRRRGIRPRIKLETQNIQTAFALASEGMGLTVCPELYLNNPYVISGTKEAPVRKDVKICRFLGGNVQDTIAIGYNKERYLSKIASDFIEMSLSAFHSPSFKKQL